MSEYKRFVSYMYNYENGIKRNNIGYVRVEARDGQCKITISIKALSFNKSSLKAYIFNRDHGGMRCTYLGDLPINNTNSEMRLTTNTDNIMKSNLSLDNMGGVIVYASAEKFFATEWDDNSIIMDQVEKALSPKEWKEEQTDIKVAQNEESYKNNLKSVLDFKKEKLEDKKEEKLESKKEKLEEKQEKLEEKDITSKDQNTALKDTEQVIDIKPILKVAKEKSANYINHSSNEGRFPIDYEFLDYYGKNRRKVKNEMIDNDFSNQKENYIRESQNSFKIFDQFPSIYPFEDKEISQCVRIEPRDIGILPMDCWILGNNSFLLHGYYNFRHLIFARRNKDNTEQYLLGVPGTYESREKFIANMFGFGEFKTGKTKMIKTGEFGYWFIEVKL